MYTGYVGFIHDNLDLSFIDKVFVIMDEQEIQTTRLIMQKESVLVGISLSSVLVVSPLRWQLN
ncbi:MAG: hypothetical protein ACEY3J_02510 [Arsenophonus sp.]